MATATQEHPQPPNLASWDIPSLNGAEAEEIPPLQSGDHLSSAEFERRYKAMPGVRAELVEGVVYVSSPVSADHGEPHLQAMFWLGTYLTTTRGVTGGVDTTIRLDLDNRPQPDGHLRIRPECGGKARISPDRYVVGAPELVIEIARSTASYDLHNKLNAYRRNEVLDYVVWRVHDRQVDWFTLRESSYERLTVSPDGLYKSPFLPGLWLDPSALVDGDYAAVLDAAQRGLASPEHAAFVAKLAAEAARLAQAAPAMPREPRP